MTSIAYWVRRSTWPSWRTWRRRSITTVRPRGESSDSLKPTSLRKAMATSTESEVGFSWSNGEGGFVIKNILFGVKIQVFSEKELIILNPHQ